MGERTKLVAAIAGVVAVVVGFVAFYRSQTISDTDRVRDQVERYADAVAGKRYSQICDQLYAPSLKQQMQSFGTSCEQTLSVAFEATVDPKIKILSIAQVDDLVSVGVESSEQGQQATSATLNLQRLDGKWLLTEQSSASTDKATATTEQNKVGSTAQAAAGEIALPGLQSRLTSISKAFASEYGVRLGDTQISGATLQERRQQRLKRRQESRAQSAQGSRSR